MVMHAKRWLAWGIVRPEPSVLSVLLPCPLPSSGSACPLNAGAERHADEGNGSGFPALFGLSMLLRFLCTLPSRAVSCGAALSEA
ncbi:hypothetical protein GCM10007301_23130 [Azorhizobium oxalatiphilum]|uniref:Uncharacterized protein n=1 Tax=Azorhizobium oxalatiphilum TaxID=980631 RepID=A0A917FBB0_9HYPH|nr:hypothetical protein GCM10007301_23130 [Azorhizobium oxalatiphilum]